MINVHIVEDKITSATGVWFYASKLLKDNDLINSGKNQYKLLLWLETENKGIVSNLVRNFIPEKSHKSIMLR